MRCARTSPVSRDEPGAALALMHRPHAGDGTMGFSADSWEIPVEVEIGDAGMDQGSENNDHQQPDD